MNIKALVYYLSSLRTIIEGFGNWYHIPLLVFIHPLQFTLKNGGVFLADNVMDIWTLKEVILDDCYQVGRVKKRTLVIDIGASIGDFSVLSSLKSKQVIACEYDENRLLLLKANIQLSKRRNIEIIPKKIQVLDSIISHTVTSCDLLKIDCEGNEYPILLNSKLTTIRKIQRIVGELHFFNNEMKEDFTRLKKRLTAAGFLFKTWNNPVHASICYFSATQ